MNARQSMKLILLVLGLAALGQASASEDGPSCQINAYPISKKVAMAKPNSYIDFPSQSMETYTWSLKRGVETEFIIYRNGKEPTKIFSLPQEKKTNSGVPYSDETLKSIPFDPKLKTVVIVAGYLTGGCEQAWQQEMKDIWLELEDANVITVRWNPTGLFTHSYAVSVSHINEVGRQISQILQNLIATHDCQGDCGDVLDRVHLIGHSLGAHISGAVGRNFQSPKIGRITGLDPAGPYFSKASRDNRLDKNNARFVEAYHTNAGKMMPKHPFFMDPFAYTMSTIEQSRYTPSFLKKLFRPNDNGDILNLGIDENVAHLDYYVNDGRIQPGCHSLIPICDHSRAYETFEAILRHEKVLREAFKSVKGEDYSTWRKSHRLIAFADNEESFKVGKNFLGKSRPQNVPIDPLSSPEQMLSELQNYLANGGSKNRHYFKTLDAEPLVGRHYILRMMLAKQAAWKDSCGLRVTFDRSPVGPKHFELIGGKIAGLDNLAIPFVYATNAEIERAFDGDDSLRRQLELDGLPTSFEIKIFTATARGLIRSTLEKINSSLRRWIPGLSNQCELEIDETWVKPALSNKKIEYHFKKDSGEKRSFKLSGEGAKVEVTY